MSPEEAARASVESWKGRSLVVSLVIGETFLASKGEIDSVSATELRLSLVGGYLQTSLVGAEFPEDSEKLVLSGNQPTDALRAEDVLFIVKPPLQLGIYLMPRD